MNVMIGINVTLATSVMKSAAYSIISAHSLIFLNIQHTIMKYITEEIMSNTLAARNILCEFDYGSVSFNFTDFW